MLFVQCVKLELELLYKVHVRCYEDEKLMKIFREIIKSMYDQDVLQDGTILLWIKKGTNPQGRLIGLPSARATNNMHNPF